MLSVSNPVSVKVRDISLEDHAQVAELELRHGLEAKTLDEWKHLWIDNPTYRKLAKSWPIGWALEDSNQKIVGYIGNIPLTYKFQGKKLLVAATHAWVVDSQYRGYSILLLDYFFSQTNVDLYLTTTLNRAAFEGFQLFKTSPVPVGEWDSTRFWITNYSGFLDSVLTAKEVPFAKLLSYALTVPAFIKDKLSRRVFRRKEFHVEFVSNFDDRFDTFWEDLQSIRSRLLLATRTRQTLNWHFKYALLRDEVWIVCIADGSRLLAYSVFYFQHNPKFRLKRVRLADFQSLRDDNSLLLPMLSAAIERCRSNGIHMLEVAGLCPAKTKVIEKLRPYHRKLSSWFAFYKANNVLLSECLKDPQVWDLSWFDTDSSL